MAIELPGVSSAHAGPGRNNRVNNEQGGTAANGSGGSAQPSVGQTVGQNSPDTVKISETAQAMQNAVQNLDSEPEVNSDRVAELKNAIDSGSYKVDAERVAKGMIDFESLFN